MTNNTNDQVTITISKKTRRVVKVENNKETPQYKPAKVQVGDKIPEQLKALFLMNPHRFQIKYI